MSLTELNKHYKTKQCQAISNMSILCVKTNQGDDECVYVCTHVHLDTLTYALSISGRILNKLETVVG